MALSSVSLRFMKNASRLHIYSFCGRQAAISVCGCKALCLPQRLMSTENQDMTYMEIPIPVYTARPDETLEQKKARLVYQSRKRGIKETDLVLSTFAHKYLDTFSKEQLDEYDKIINLPSNDWDIYYWATGVEEVPEEFNGPIMKMLQEHTRNDDKESRYKQPDLPIN